MFDKLGDMLNECLEMGQIPPARPRRRVYKNQEDLSAASHGSEQALAESLSLPHDIEEAFVLLGLIPTEGDDEITALPALGQVRASYARLLKEAHPDTAQQGIDPPHAAQRIARLTSAFTKVREWYRKMGM